MRIRHGRMAKAPRRGIGGTGEMNKSAIVARVAARMGLNKFTAEGSVDTVFEAIAEGLAKEEEVRIAGFGTFGTRSRAARTGRNPRTGESVPIPASKSPSFKAAKRLREAVKRGWQEEQAEPGDVHHGRPGSAGAMLEMSDWPGGVEPVWTLLESESMEALRAEPFAGRALGGQPDAVPRGRSAGRGVRRIGVRTQCADRAAAHKRRVLAEAHPEGTFRARHGCGDARGDDLAGDGGDRAVPRGKGDARGRRVGASSAASVDGIGRAYRGAGGAVPVEPLGREMLEPGRRGALQTVLFRHLYWHANLSQFVETFPRGLPGRWPQDDIGVILWGLSNVVGEWQSADTLRTLTTVRDDSVAGLHWNAEGTMFAGRVLGPLRWFGLLEYHGPPERFEVGWRKTALFDRFLSFDVQLSQERGTGH